MDYKLFIIDRLFSFDWAWFVIGCFAFIIARKYINNKKIDTTITRDTLIKDTKYSEDEIIGHLDYIINEALDEYVLINIATKDNTYINSQIQREIFDYLSEEVPNRMSETLKTQLAFIYNSDYIGKFIGTRIYITVTNYVVDYNLGADTPAPVGKTDIGDTLMEV